MTNINKKKKRIFIFSVLRAPYTIPSLPLLSSGTPLKKKKKKKEYLFSFFLLPPAAKKKRRRRKHHIHLFFFFFLSPYRQPRRHRRQRRAPAPRRRAARGARARHRCRRATAAATSPLLLPLRYLFFPVHTATPPFTASWRSHSRNGRARPASHPTSLRERFSMRGRISEF